VRTVATSNTSPIVANKGQNNITSYTDSSGRTVLLPSQAYDLTTYSCNQGCNSNRDCDADLRCYRGKCRLADDPESATCVVDKSDQEEDSSSSAAITATPSPRVSESAPEPQLQSNPLQTTLNRFLASFSWQWLAIAGGIMLLALTLIIGSISRAKKDPWAIPISKSDSKPEEKLQIPEDKPLKL